MLSRSMKFSAKKEFFMSSICQSLIFKKDLFKRIPKIVSNVLGKD
jgi:hypothetical protein